MLHCRRKKKHKWWGCRSLLFLYGLTHIQHNQVIEFTVSCFISLLPLHIPVWLPTQLRSRQASSQSIVGLKQQETLNHDIFIFICSVHLCQDSQKPNWAGKQDLMQEEFFKILKGSTTVLSLLSCSVYLVLVETLATFQWHPNSFCWFIKTG